ncbi:MAG: hypothetical protein E7571_08520 [Ruminococcaceae bacterium]|jgi:hypothetical protein|nr:hypothetical protein [Oscillospiraceae bacterium]
MRKLSKRIIAVVLSALMVVTAMPMVSITAFAEDAAITAYDAAVAAYVSKMDGTVYTNMGEVYAKYVDANEAYDAYVYGQGTAAALNSAVTALNTATATLDDAHKWTQSIANASVYSRDSNTAIGSSYAKNILYADRQDTLVDEGSNANVRVQIQYGTNNVLLYDGKNDILFPVAVFYYYDQAGFSSRKMFTMYPSNGDNVQLPADSSDFRLQDQWNGKMDYGTADWNSARTQTDRIPGYQHDSGLTPDGAPNGNRNKWNYFANYMKYVGGANGFTDGLKTLHPSWYAYTGYSSSNNRVDHYLNNAGNIYIIDYATALSAIDTKTYLSQVASYKSNGLAAYLNAYDALTVDVASYDYATNPSGTAASVASSLATAAATVNNTTSPDGDAGYTALRHAITTAKTTFEEGNDDNFFNSTLWTTFSNAYIAARDNMTNLPSNGYSTSAAAQTLADRLTTAYNNLIGSISVVDTTALETAIDDAQIAIDKSGYFTTASFANADLQNVINAAKTAVWQSVDKYKSMRAKGQTTDATVAAQLTNIQNAVKKLVIDKNATVASAGDYSAITVVAHANDTSVYTPTDYANWNTVTAAVSAVDEYNVNIATYVDNCVATKIASYEDTVRAVVTALKELKDAFSKMENGQLISAGTMQTAVSAVGSPDSTGAGQDFRVNFWGYSDSVVFRTTHAADYLTLPDSYISLWTQSGYPVGLDSINIDDPSTYANSNGNGQITSGGNGDNKAVGQDLIDSENFAGSLVASNEGTDTKGGRLVLGNVASRPDSGIFVNASRVWPITNNVYAIDADGTMHYTTDDVSNDNLFTTDLTDTIGTFDNIDNHPNNANYGAYGAVWADNKGTTEMQASTSLYVTVENSNKLTKNTKLTIDEYNFVNREFGVLLWWKYMNINTFGYTYHGYRHDYTNYSRAVKVVNIADLFRLIDECENAGYVSSNYTTDSWNAYATALDGAKADLDYSDKSAEWVLEQCQGRYDDLWAAKEALVRVVDFTPLDEAVAALKTKVESGQFTTASINAAASALQSVNYFWLTQAERKTKVLSDAETTNVANAAAAVTSAANLLVAVDDDVVNNADDIASAAQAELDNSNKDPDAYNYDAIQDVIDNLNAKTTNLSVYSDNLYYGNLSTTGYTWQHMAEVQAIVTDALTNNFRTYDITITGISDANSMAYEYVIGGQTYTSTGATLEDIPYGTSVKFSAPDGKRVNWYYTYSSATTGNTKEKYLTNDKEINFVVNGDITFRLDNETDAEDETNFRITYANNLRNTAYKMEYVKAGNITLPAAPTIANYTFKNYTVDGQTKNAGDVINITKHTMVIANYDYTATEMDIVIYNMNGSISGSGYATANYNEKVEISYEGLSTRTPYITIEGENVNIAKSRQSYAGDSIYAFTVITGDDNMETFDTYVENREEDDYGEIAGAPELEGMETVLAYGDSYTFYVSESMYIIPYTYEEFVTAKGGVDGAADQTAYINTDYVDDNGATAFASQSIMNVGTKLSIVSNYVLPDGCELIEAGILFTAKKDGTVPTADLTFKTVGTNGVARLKSTQHTVGNQFVISPIQITTAIKGKTITAKYVAYITYEDASGNQFTVMSAPVTSSVIA